MATSLHPYVSFDGTCADAVAFYGDVLRAEVKVMRFGDAPSAMPDAPADRVMHATVTGDGLLLMASDSMPGSPPPSGQRVALSLSFTDRAEQSRVWDALAAGGSVLMPLGDTFWGRFGMLVDRFGVRWMINHEAPRDGSSG